MLQANHLESPERLAWLASPARAAAIAEAYRRRAALGTRPEATATDEQRQARTFAEMMASPEVQNSPLVKACARLAASGE